jgi:integrase
MLYNTIASNSPISELSRQQCTAALISQKSKWSNTTFNNNLTFCRAIFSYLIENDILEKNPFKSIKPLPETKERNQPIDNKSWEKIKENASPDLLSFLTFLYHTGARPNEARQLKYEHILHDRGLVFIPASISKNKQDGYIQVSRQYLNTLKGEGFIFGTSVSHYGKVFNEIKVKIGLPKGINLYSIKHTRACHMAEAGVSPYAIMQLFRHHSISVTMSYLKGLGLSLSEGATDIGLRL